MNWEYIQRYFCYIRQGWFVRKWCVCDFLPAVFLIIIKPHVRNESVFVDDLEVNKIQSLSVFTFCFSVTTAEKIFFFLWKIADNLAEWNFNYLSAKMLPLSASFGSNNSSVWMCFAAILWSSFHILTTRGHHNV